MLESATFRGCGFLFGLKPEVSAEILMKSYLKTSITFALLLVMVACSVSKLTRTINVIESLKPSIKAFHRSNEAEILTAVDEIVEGIKVFRDNPTRSNYRNALAILDRQIERNIFNFSQGVLQVITAGRALLAALLPAEDAQMMRADVAMDEKVNVKEIDEAALKRLEDAARKLKAEVGR